MNKKKSFKQLFAIGAIVLLVFMYAISIVFALMNNELGFKLLQLSLAMTFFIPVIIYLFMMFYKLSHKKDDANEEKDSFENNEHI